MSKLLCAFALGLVVAFTGCGYQRVGAATHVPANVRTLAVPIFQSKVQAYNTETTFTEAVVRELNTRTRYRVLTGVRSNVEPTAQAADATLRGTILTQSVTPLTYDATSGQTSRRRASAMAPFCSTLRPRKVVATATAVFAAWVQN